MHLNSLREGIEVDIEDFEDIMRDIMVVILGKEGTSFELSDIESQGIKARFLDIVVIEGKVDIAIGWEAIILKDMGKEDIDQVEDSLLVKDIMFLILQDYID